MAMKIARIISILTVLTVLFSVFVIPGAVLAQDEPPVPADIIALTTEFPEIEAIATGTFQFAVALRYKGLKDRIFDLNATVPQGWDVYITPQYDSSKRIPSITMEASFTGVSKTVQLTTSVASWPLPDPGEYKILLEVVSDDVKATIELTAKVTGKYSLAAAPVKTLYNTKAKAGSDNTYSILINNTGTDAIDNITFSSDKPEGWEITFKPEKIEQLEMLGARTVDVNIKPPPKTVSGDYMIDLWASGKQANADKMSVRVTVETPTIWGWVGVIIIILVVAGLVIIFMRFGRR
jgi:uncharacterized repeat protein (TIGR01451 family)